MARKKNDSPAVSLFAFQDIITSVTGIMILVVIMLVLEIITPRKTSSQSGDVAEKAPKIATTRQEPLQEEPDNSDLKLERKKLQAQRKLLEKRLLALKNMQEKFELKSSKQLQIRHLAVCCGENNIDIFLNRKLFSRIENQSLTCTRMARESLEKLKSLSVTGIPVTVFTRPSASSFIRGYIRRLNQIGFGIATLEPVLEQEVLCQ